MHGIAQIRTVIEANVIFARGDAEGGGGHREREDDDKCLVMAHIKLAHVPAPRTP